MDRIPDQHRRHQNYKATVKKCLLQVNVKSIQIHQAFLGLFPSKRRLGLSATYDQQSSFFSLPALLPLILTNPGDCNCLAECLHLRSTQSTPIHSLNSTRPFHNHFTRVEAETQHNYCEIQYLRPAAGI